MEPVYDLQAEYRALAETVDVQPADRMQQYGLDPAEGWTRLLEEDTPADVYDVVIAPDEEVYKGVQEAPVAEDAYAVAVDAVAGDEVYARYVEDDEGTGYIDIAVVETELPDGFFGFTFTGPDSDDVVFVNKALYEVDKERTKLHEIDHKEKPHFSEFQIRYDGHVGVVDVENTTSFRGEHTPRISQYMQHTPDEAYV